MSSAFDPALMALTDQFTREVFEIIADRVKVRHVELSSRVQRDEVGTTAGEPTEVANTKMESRLLKAVDALKTANLIKEKPATVPIFRSYFMTPRGLETARQLNRVKASV
jgi:hypothetical protein